MHLLNLKGESQWYKDVQINGCGPCITMIYDPFTSERCKLDWIMSYIVDRGIGGINDKSVEDMQVII